MDFLFELRFGVAGSCEPDAAGRHPRHLGGSEVGGHENDGLRKVDLSIVAKGQHAFVEHAQKQLPKRVAGLLDLGLVKAAMGRFSTAFFATTFGPRRV